MKKITLILALISGTVYSQEISSDILKDARWTLTSKQYLSTVFSADTLSFVNCNNCRINDSISLKPRLVFYEIFGDYFSFSFNGIYSENKTSKHLSWKEAQYGYWQLDQTSKVITFQLLEPDGKTDDFNKWTKKQKYNYLIIELSYHKLVLIRK